jgi:hypothetical protein
LQHDFGVALDDLHRRQDEIQFRLGQETQTFVLMFGAIAAIAGSQLLAQAAPHFAQAIHRNPWAIMLVALLFLWFPATNIVAWADISIAAAYINQVAAPRLRLLIDVERKSLLTLTLRQDIEREEHAVLGRWRSHLAWEAYRAENFYRRRLKFALFPLWIFRTLLLFAPSAISVAFYSTLRFSRLPVGVTWPDMLSSSAYAIILISIIIALFTTSNLPHMHRTRVDPAFYE